jgi:RNA polymerase sigma-70 factor (ECF subfamily)
VTRRKKFRVGGIIIITLRYVAERDRGSLLSVDIRPLLIRALPKLRAFAWSLTRSREAADDLVQGACERALAASASWQPGTNFEGWMCRILRNLWIDAFRARRSETPIEDWPDLPGQDGRATTEARLTLQATQAAIAALPEEQRSVLVLVCVEEMSYRDTAEALDIPVGTVMSRLARARAAVAAALHATPEPRSAGMGARR